MLSREAMRLVIRVAIGAYLLGSLGAVTFCFVVGAFLFSCTLVVPKIKARAGEWMGLLVSWWRTHSEAPRPQVAPPVGPEALLPEAETLPNTPEIVRLTNEWVSWIFNIEHWTRIENFLIFTGSMAEYAFAVWKREECEKENLQ